MSRSYVIRIDREGTAPRWVRKISRTPGECTVTWHQADARRMGEATACAHVAQLEAAALQAFTLTVEAIEATPATPSEATA